MPFLIQPDSHIPKPAATGGALIIDLGQVDDLASMGMRAIIMGAKAATVRGGKPVLLSAGAAVEEVLTMAGIDQLIPIYHDLTEARPALQA